MCDFQLDAVFVTPGHAGFHGHADLQGCADFDADFHTDSDFHGPMTGGADLPLETFAKSLAGKEELDADAALTQIGFRWCSKLGAIIIGGMALDLWFAHTEQKDYYPPTKIGDVDAKLSTPMLARCQETIDEILKEIDPAAQLKINGNPPTPYLAYGAFGFSTLFINGVKCVEFRTTTEEVFAAMETAKVPLKDAMARYAPPRIKSKSAFNPCGGGTPFKTVASDAGMLNVLVPGRVCLTYLAFVANADERMYAIRTQKAFRNVLKVADLLGKGLPKQPSLRTPAERKARIAHYERVMPLLDSCYYTAATAMDIIFKNFESGSNNFESGSKSGSNKCGAVHIRAFSNVRDKVFAYMEKYGYAHYERFLREDWALIPPMITLTPPPGLPTLVIHDSGTTSGRVNGKVVGYIYAASDLGLEDVLRALSFLSNSPGSVLEMLEQDTPVGRSTANTHLLGVPANIAVHRDDVLTNEQFLVEAKKIARENSKFSVERMKAYQHH